MKPYKPSYRTLLKLWRNADYSLFLIRKVVSDNQKKGLHTLDPKLTLAVDILAEQGMDWRQAQSFRAAGVMPNKNR